MQNVIAFPKQAAPKPVRTTAVGATTLFLHIRRTSLILHLAASQIAAEGHPRIGKRS